jgi:hypothetical protein
MKYWYQSKTIMVQILAGIAIIVGVFVPGVGEFLAEHFAEAGAGWVAINTILRFVTKDKVQIK